MLSRNLRLPHTLYCITDDPTGLDERIVYFPIWPANGLGRCRRLRIFDSGMRYFFGERILQLDIDCIITGNITPLVERSESLVMWKSVPETKVSVKTGISKPNPENGVGAYNTSMILMDTGVMPEIWPMYCEDPETVELEAKRKGFWTAVKYASKLRILDSGDDDQAVVSLFASKLNPPVWGEADGVYKVGRRGFKDKTKLPENAKIVFFNGSLNCNMQDVGKLGWFQEHWC